MSGTEPWRPSTSGLYRDVAAGLVVYGAIIAAPVSLPVVLGLMVAAAGLRPLPPLFAPMMLVSLVGIGMVVTGLVMLRREQEERRRRLREFDGLPW